MPKTKILEPVADWEKVEFQVRLAEQRERDEIMRVQMGHMNRVLQRDFNSYLEDDVIEKKLEKDCVSFAENLGFMTYKMETHGVRGWPDRSFYGPDGIHFLVEFKVPGKEPTPQQIDIIEKLVALGQDVWVIDNLPEFINGITVEVRNASPF